jgi:hypothetical protein
MFAVTTPDASHVTITEDGEMVPRTNASDGEANTERASRQHLSFVTLSSPSSLEPFLAQLGPKWGPLRQTVGPAARVQGGIHLQIDGFVFWLGSDWIIRVGNVTQAGVAGPRGIVLEVNCEG